MKTYFAPGKVMLCGEYAVMSGVPALAFPSYKGQWMRVWDANFEGNGILNWESKDLHGEKWFECKIDTTQMKVISSNNEDVSGVLLSLLKVIESKSPAFFNGKYCRIETNTEFSVNSGLGTSSSLIVLLSKWTGVNAFELQKEVFGGSGYDVACALLARPVRFWLEDNEPCWDSYVLNSELTKDWFVVFPGKKRNSREALTEVKEKLSALASDALMLMQLKQIAAMISHANNTHMLEAGLEMWQAILSSYLELPKAYDYLGLKPVKGGLCKWLGAWGGDMILMNKTMLNEYSADLNEFEICSWNELVIQE